MKKIIAVVVMAFVTSCFASTVFQSNTPGKWAYLLHVFKGSESGIGESPICTGSKSEH